MSCFGTSRDVSSILGLVYNGSEGLSGHLTVDGQKAIGCVVGDLRHEMQAGGLWR